MFICFFSHCKHVNLMAQWLARTIAADRYCASAVCVWLQGQQGWLDQIIASRERELQILERLKHIICYFQDRTLQIIKPPSSMPRASPGISALLFKMKYKSGWKIHDCSSVAAYPWNQKKSASGVGADCEQKDVGQWQGSSSGLSLFIIWSPRHDMVKKNFSLYI